MSPDERREFEEFQAEQRRLRLALEKLDARFEALSRSVEKAPEAKEKPEPPPLPPPPPPYIPPPFIPSVLDERGALISPPADIEPAISPLRAAKLPTDAPATETPPPAPALAPSTAASPPPPPPAPRRELELQLGTVWLARIGIVILLTGLVFLGNYAWHNWVSRMGSGGKLAIIYLAGAALCGVGAWLRRRQESVRNYAQVLIAGGGATIYYATYAAHFVERLRIIESPIVGGVLLLLIGGGFLAWADWRKLQPAALLAIVLSYYTSAINEVGTFTLFSSLLLTAAGVFLVMRHQWIAVSWATLAGTYGSFAYWDWFRAVAGTPHAAQEPWGPALGFLTAYWLLFTVVVFFSRPTSFPAPLRVAFLSLNNAGFYFLGLRLLLPNTTQAPWMFTFSLGLALLALAGAAWRWRREQLDLDSAYLLQGVGLVSAGLAMKLSGENLAFVLAVESLILLSGSGRRHGWLFELLGGLTATWAFGEGLWVLDRNPEHMGVIGFGLGALLIADAWWIKVRRGSWREMKLHWRAFVFSGFALLLIARVLPQLVNYPWEPTALALAAVVFTASIYFLRLPELTLLAQLYLVAALAMWLLDLRGQVEAAPWWQPWPLALSALGLSHWWQRQRIWKDAGATSTVLQLVMAAALTVVVFAKLQNHFHADPRLLGFTIAAVATLAYGYLTRSWAVALCGQLFAVLSVAFFFVRLSEVRPAWPIGLSPVVMLLATSALLALAPTERWGTRVGRAGMQPVSLVYWSVGWLVLTVWVFAYLPEAWWSLTFAVLSAGLLAAGAFGGKRFAQITGVVLLGLSYIAFFGHLHTPPTFAEIVAIILPPLFLRFAARRADPAAVLGWLLPAVSAFTVGCLWLWATRWTNWHHHGDILTVIWAVLALFVLAAGFALRERMYRLGGMAILGLSIGRIFVVDVWALETIYRIISFLTLGAVLLALGYLYNRFSDRIRKWL